jgi:histone deacetylase 6
MTYNNPHILYFSIHRYQGGQFYPNTGAAEDTGGEHAPGSNINVPLNFKGLGDAEYLDTFRTLLIPCVQEFAPDLIVISAGFDCAQGDPLGGMECSSEGFAHMTRLLQDAMPHRRVVMALEGGYNVRAVSEAVVACTKTLLGDPLPELADPHSFLGKRELAKVAQKRELFRKDLLHCVKVQKRFWKCLSGIPTPETPEPTAAAAAPSSSASASAPPPSVAGLTVAAAALSVSNVTVAAPKSPPAK